LWGLGENTEYLREEAVLLHGFRPSSNLAEVQNATFWVRAGEKGPYLTRADALMVESSNAIFQIVERKRFELTDETGEGPSVATLAARSGRRQDVREEGLGRKRLSLDCLSVEAQQPRTA
jgi:hypothetical protein